MFGSYRQNIKQKKDDKVIYESIFMKFKSA